MAISNGMADQGWYLDSGATHHLTNASQNLNDGKIYLGSNSLLVSNGQGLKITHTGYICFKTSFGTCLHLKSDIYSITCISCITNTFISFTTSTSCSFSPIIYQINITIFFIIFTHLTSSTT